MTGVAEPVLDTRALVVDLLRAVRPNQWIKNVLVVAAPAAAGVLLEPAVLWSSVLAVLAITATASACYLVNDVLDAPLDRMHPRKRCRPIASGQIPGNVALAMAGGLLLVGHVIALSAGGAVVAVVAAYAMLTLAYAAVLKRVPLLEMAVVASGFLLRALAGAAAARVPVSGWFLLVVSTAAVLVVAAKRSSELLEVGSGSRPVLRWYNRRALRRLRLSCSVVLVLAYLGWALTRPPVAAAMVLAVLSVVPLVAVVVRWGTQTDDGATGAPEEVLIHDRVVRWGVSTWAALFTCAVLVTSRVG